MYFINVLLVLLLAGCGQGVLSTFVSEISTAKTEAAQDNSVPSSVSIKESEPGEESVPPSMVTGASLTCEVSAKDDKDKFIEIFCHLEKEGKILNDVNLIASDIDIHNDNGDSLILDFSDQNNGNFLIKVAYQESGDINISLKSIQGTTIKQADTEDLATVILHEELAPTPEENQNTDQQQLGNPIPANDSSNSDTNGQDQLSEDSGDNNSTTVQNTTVCDYIGEPGTWILVPGDPNYGTSDFCVMKYEAKCSLTDGKLCTIDMRPISKAENTPWVNINQQQAEEECASLGKGYHLITNKEWMTIGTNIANVGANWGTGVVGAAKLKKGHSDNNPSQACPASNDDSLNVVETDCANQASKNDAFVQQRTHTLSNGSVIWDFSGNVWEWTSFYNAQEKPTPHGNTWYEYSLPIVGTSSLPVSDLIPQIAIDNGWNSTQSIGKYYPGNTNSGGVLRRGGDWMENNKAGVFSADLRHGQNPAPFDDRGFRCVVSTTP